MLVLHNKDDTINREKKIKEECNKSTVTCDVSTAQYKDSTIKCEKKGENTLLVHTFWFNSHFGPKIDFVTNVTPEKRKSFLKRFMSSTY